MKLRKARKAPKRFDDYEWEEEEEDHEARVTTTSPKPRAYSAMHLRPHTLPYNPNLPPAAFPTLEYGVPREANSVATESESPHAKSLVLNTKIQSHIKWLRNNKTIGQKVEPAKIPVPPSYTTPLDVQPDSMYDKLSRMTAQRETAEIIYHQQQRGNEVYARNMEILDRMAKRTDDDWNIQEMMTSDEEDASPVTCNQTKEVRHTRFQLSSLSANTMSVYVGTHTDTHWNSFCCILGYTLDYTPTRFSSHNVRDLRKYHGSDATATSEYPSKSKNAQSYRALP